MTGREHYLKTHLGATVRHFKGAKYLILNIATHSETNEEFVVYKALYGEYKTYIRPLSMFLEKTDKIKYPECTQEYRFEFLNVDNVTEQ